MDGVSVLLLYARWGNLPCVSLGKTSSKGDGSVCWGLVGGVDGDSVIGIHLRRFGVLCAGLWSGSNSKLLFRVAPQAILPK